MNEIPSPSAITPEPTMFFESDEEQPHLVFLPHGTAAVLSRCHPGRKPNQDAAAVIPAGPEDALLAVADGMGGSREGGLAAATVIRNLAGRLPVDADDQLLRTAILDGVESANRHLLENSPQSGTTLAALEIRGHTVRPYHVGDSVILIVGQRGKLKLQTVSHSPVGFAVESGMLNEKEALHHHERHIINNAVGLAEMRIELGAPLELAPRDTILLASDGLTDNLRLEEIVELIRKGPLDQAVTGLAALALRRMTEAPAGQPSKPDDLTMILYRRSA